MVRAPSPAKPLTSVSGREPQAGNYGIAARPPAGGSAGSRSIPRKAFNFGFRARTPGRKLRKRRTERRLGAHMVRAPFPANPLVSVSGREPRAGIFGFSGTAAGLVRARVPANPLISVSGREPRAGIFEFGGPPAGYLVCRFAPRSPLALVLTFRGAKSSHNFRAPTWGRPTFPRRGLLPAAR